MRFELEIGGERLWLNPAAISAVRYRARHGSSVVTDLMQAKTPDKLQQCLIHMLEAMCEDAHVGLLELASRCRRDEQFLQKGLLARDALLNHSQKHKEVEQDEGTEPFDEYRVLAILASAGLDMALLYELPILHLLEVATLCFEWRSDKKTYRRMTQGEMKALYPK